MKKIILLLIIINCFHCIAIAQWVPIGPYGGFINNIAYSGTNLIVSTGSGYNGNSSGIFYSSNNGNNWVIANNGLATGYDVCALIFSGDTILAGTYGGIYISTNFGTVWVQKWLTNHFILSIVANGNTIFAGTDDSGVYRTTNKGDNWTKVNNGLTGLIILSLCNSGNNLYAVVSEKGIFLSTNNGDSWAEKNWGFSGYPPDIGSITSLNSYMFASWFKGGVYRSTNNGTNWYSYSSGLTYPTWVIKGFNNILYAGTANDNDPNSGWGIFRTTNYGNNWSLLNNSFSNQVVNDFAFSSSYMFTGVRFGDGIFRSSNNGTSWTPTNNGMYDLEVRGLSSSNSYLYAGTYNYYNGGKIFRSSTNGINWEITSNDLQRADINVLVASGTNVYAGTTDSGIYISTNEGINWFKAGRNGLPSYDIRALNTSGTNIYAGVAGDLYMTTNNGLNWRTDTLQIQANGVRDIVFSGANILVGFDIGGVYRSVDNGISWVRVNSGLPYPNTSGLTCMTVNGQNIFAGFYYGKGIFMTTNYGDNWINISNGLSNLSITAVAAIGSDIFIGTDTNTIYHSFNLGVNWSKINPGLSSYPFVPYINKLYISGNYIYAATDKQSVWRRPLSDFVGIKIISSEVPNKFSLSQNYPNPFNPVTKIKFTVANGFPIKTFGNDKGGVFVTLKVFDILGREVATLVNEQLAPGTYEVEWNASQFSSGVYFYQFNAENYIATKKLILLK